MTSGCESVCIVDDDPAVRDSMTLALEAYGFRALSYGSGAEFLADRGHAGVSCLVIDQHMPGPKGLDVVAAMRRNENAVPTTILVTGALDPAIVKQADKLGVLAVLEKPFRVGRLIALVRGGLADA